MNLLRKLQLTSLFACGLTLAKASLSGCADDGEHRLSMEQSCTKLADALEMPRAGISELLETDSGYEYHEGELVCTFSQSGSLKLITQGSLYSGPGEGVPLLLDSAQAQSKADQALSRTDFGFIGPVEVKPSEPWDDDVNLISVISQPEAYGYPTHGFAGSVEVVINRYTGSVVAIGLKSERVPDPPVFNVTEQEALDMAEPIWASSVYGGKANIKRKANKQYYVALGDGATAAGKRYAEQNRVRMCWQIAYWMEAKARGGQVLRKPLADVIIDAETGEVLMNPPFQ